MKTKNITKTIMVLLVVFFLIPFVSGEDESKPVSGYVYLENSDAAYNATVNIKANVGKNNDLCSVYQSDPTSFPQFEKYCYGCNCSAPITFSHSNGIYVENLGNLVHESNCEITSDSIGGECGDDWSKRTENTVWAEFFGNTINPIQGNNILAPVSVESGGGTQWLVDITLPAGPDLSPEIVDISPGGWVSEIETTLHVETNELTTCKLSLTSKPYADKEYTLEGTTRYHNITITLASGANDFYIQCQDQSTLLSSEELHTVNLDTQVPETADNFDDQWHNQSVTVTLTRDCGPSGCDWTRYCTGTTCNPAIGYDSPILISDYTTLKYRSKDEAGNTEEIKSTLIKIDKEIPNTFDNYGGGTYNYDLYIIITSSCGLSSCQYTKYCVGSADCIPNIDYTGAIFFDSSTYLRYHSKDYAGNVQPIQTTQISIDKSSPPSGDSRDASERHYPGKLVEPETEIPTTPPTQPVQTFTPPTEEEINITTPEEYFSQEPVPEPEPVKIKWIWYIIPILIIIIAIIIIIILIAKRRKDKEEKQQTNSQ